MPTLTCRDLGPIDFLEDDILSFPDGVPAFEALRRFLLVRDDNFAPFVFLVSVDSPLTRFICVPVSLLDPEYRIELEWNEGRPAGLADGIYTASSPDPLILGVVTLPNSAPPTVNLASPVVVNASLRLGAQLILPETPYSHVAPLRPSTAVEEPC